MPAGRGSLRWPAKEPHAQNLGAEFRQIIVTPQVAQSNIKRCIASEVQTSRQRGYVIGLRICQQF